MSVLLSSDSGPARGGVLDRRRGSSRLSVKKLGESDSLDDARQEIQELHHSLNSNMSARYSLPSTLLMEYKSNYNLTLVDKVRLCYLQCPQEADHSRGER